MLHSLKYLKNSHQHKYAATAKKKQNTNIKGIKNIGIRTWKCQKCNTIHDRDINASINILNEGLKIVGTTMQ